MLVSQKKERKKKAFDEIKEAYSKEKVNKKHQKALIKQILISFKAQKFINPSKIILFEEGLCISEENLYDSISCDKIIKSEREINNLRGVAYTEYNDEYKYVNIHLYQKQYSELPIQYIIERFKSFQSENFYQLACILEEFNKFQMNLKDLSQKQIQDTEQDQKIEQNQIETKIQSIIDENKLNKNSIYFMAVVKESTKNPGYSVYDQLVMNKGIMNLLDYNYTKHVFQMIPQIISPKEYFQTVKDIYSVRMKKQHNLDSKNQFSFNYKSEQRLQTRDNQQITATQQTKMYKMGKYTMYLYIYTSPKIQLDKKSDAHAISLQNQEQLVQKRIRIEDNVENQIQPESVYYFNLDLQTPQDEEFRWVEKDKVKQKMKKKASFRIISNSYNQLIQNDNQKQSAPQDNNINNEQLINEQKIKS